MYRVLWQLLHSVPHFLCKLYRTWTQVHGWANVVKKHCLLLQSQRKVDEGHDSFTKNGGRIYSSMKFLVKVEFIKVAVRSNVPVDLLAGLLVQLHPQNSILLIDNRDWIGSGYPVWIEGYGSSITRPVRRGGSGGSIKPPPPFSSCYTHEFIWHICKPHPFNWK